MSTENLDCNSECSGALSAGNWTNTTPGGGVDEDENIIYPTLYGSGDNWFLSACNFASVSEDDSNGDGTHTVTANYGADGANYPCELSSDVYNYIIEYYYSNICLSIIIFNAWYPLYKLYGIWNYNVNFQTFIGKLYIISIYLYMNSLVYMASLLKIEV